MDSRDAASHDARASAPVYIICDDEILIDAPIDVAWHRAIDYASWQNYSFVQHVSGEPGQEGEVVFLEKVGAGVKIPPVYGRTIKLDPPNRIMWKTYRECSDFFGIVEFRLCETGSMTRFSVNLLYEYVLPYQHEGELDAFRRERYELIKKAHSVVLPRLKALAEEDGRES